jgi:hypothetical protein
MKRRIRNPEERAPKMKTYFSDFFNVDPEALEQYGAFN